VNIHIKYFSSAKVIEILLYFAFVIRIENLTKNYGTLAVLKGVQLEVAKGEVLAIVGASGAGKSTLLQIIGTLDQPDSGQVFYNNNDVFALSKNALNSFRNANIGFVFQFHNLLPEFTAVENVMMPALIKGMSHQEARSAAMELLNQLHVEARAEHKPNALSGGEQQRVAVARALINKPAVVLADEPSGNLDSSHAEELHQLFFSLREKFEQTFIIVTHNDQLAKMADRTLKMSDGQII
jgi:lipoprotein-releasing system ATP-binding protein